MLTSHGEDSAIGTPTPYGTLKTSLRRYPSLTMVKLPGLKTFEKQYFPFIHPSSQMIHPQYRGKFTMPWFKVSHLFEKFNGQKLCIAVKSLCTSFWKIHINVRLPGEVKSNQVRLKRKLTGAPEVVITLPCF